MDIGSYLKATALNLGLVASGALIGPTVVKSAALFHVVHAQDKGAPKFTAKGDKGDKGDPAVAPLDPNYEYVAPVISAGSAAFATVLAGRIATDQLTVNGYDILKIENGLLTAMVQRGLITSAQAQELVGASRLAKPLRLQPPPPPKE